MTPVKAVDDLCSDHDRQSISDLASQMFLHPWIPLEDAKNMLVVVHFACATGMSVGEDSNPLARL